MKNKIVIISIIVILMVSNIGCSKSLDNPSQSVELYLKAIVNKESEKVISLSCKSWESNAQKEIDSLMNVTASLDNVNCLTKSQSGDQATVECQGKIKFTYDTETQELDLSKRAYIVVLENGEWKVCNYQ